MASAPALSTLTATLVTGYCVWIRRSTYRCTWERGTTITTTGMFLCLMLVAPPISHPLIASGFHEVTGCWNMEDLLGHLAYLAGLVGLMHALAYRITLENPHEWLRRRLELPTLFGVPALVGIYLWAMPDEEILFPYRNTLPLSVYWIAICVAASYLYWCIVTMLWVIRRDRRSRVIADIYLVTICAGCLGSVSVVMSSTVESYPDGITWAVFSVVCTGYAVASALSWRRKMQAGFDLR